jgi:site-specific DNA recombinase
MIPTVAPDPQRAPFVRLAFELYASGEYTLDRLTQTMAASASAVAPPSAPPPSRRRWPSCTAC